jgi:hypothetical protein
MLLTTLIDARLGIIVTAALAMVVAYLAGSQLELAFMGFIGAVIMALIYNIVARVVGGIQVDVS